MFLLELFLEPKPAPTLDGRLPLVVNHAMPMAVRVPLVINLMLLPALGAVLLGYVPALREWAIFAADVDHFGHTVFSTALALMALGLVLFLGVSLRRYRFAVDRSMVSFRRQGPLGSVEWRESLSNYQGVVARRRSSNTATYEVRLVHRRNSARHVPLYVVKEFDEAAWLRDEVARHLGVAKLDGD